MPDPHLPGIFDPPLLQLEGGPLKDEAAGVGLIGKNLSDRFAGPAQAARGANVLGIQLGRDVAKPLPFESDRLEHAPDGLDLTVGLVNDLYIRSV